MTEPRPRAGGVTRASTPDRTGPVVYDAILGFGSNMGDKAGNIREAIHRIGGNGEVRVVAVSKLYSSPPWGVKDQDGFVNACAAVQTEIGAAELLRRCQQVENDMGRVRQQKWGPRLIDVDILTYRDQIIDEPDLKVPHPFIAERSFVLVPMADLDPELVLGGRSLADLIAAIDTSDLSVLAE